MSRRVLGFTCALLVTCVFPAQAQVLIASDDVYGIPFGQTLVVDPFGVLANDLLDGENAGEGGATAQLVTDVLHGTLSLNTDGSFTYQIGPTFAGTDSFRYRAEFGAVTSEATVVLSGCSGGPDVFACWHETAFTDKAASLGYGSFQEGFEDDAAWGIARSPNTVPNVVSQGIRWQSNHPDPPASNDITTGSGPARTGQWAIFDLEHGYATGTAGQCDVNNPPATCLFHDGVTGVREPGYRPLHGVGGYFTGTFGANVAFILDGDELNPIAGGKLTGGHQFFGVIDARSAGFTRFECRELDGKVGQALFIFADDFTMIGSSEPLPALPPQWLIGLALVQLLAAGWYLKRREFSRSREPSALSDRPSRKP